MWPAYIYAYVHMNVTCIYIYIYIYYAHIYINVTCRVAVPICWIWLRSRAICRKSHPCSGMFSGYEFPVFFLAQFYQFLPQNWCNRWSFPCTLLQLFRFQIRLLPSYFIWLILYFSQLILRLILQSFTLFSNLSLLT